MCVCVMYARICMLLYVVSLELKTMKSKRKELASIEDPDDLEPEERAKIEELEQKMYDPVCTSCYSVTL